MHITLLINTSAIICTAPDLYGLVSAKLVVSQVAASRYLESSKSFGINLMSTNKYLLVNS